MVRAVIIIAACQPLQLVSRLCMLLAKAPRRFKDKSLKRPLGLLRMAGEVAEAEDVAEATTPAVHGIRASCDAM